MVINWRNSLTNFFVTLSYRLASCNLLSFCFFFCHFSVFYYFHNGRTKRMKFSGFELTIDSKCCVCCKFVSKKKTVLPVCNMLSWLNFIFFGLSQSISFYLVFELYWRELRDLFILVSWRNLGNLEDIGRVIFSVNYNFSMYKLISNGIK